jgi:ribonuclease Z
MRVKLSYAAAVWSLATSVLCVSAARAQDIRVTLLGTGSPMPVVSRFGPSILVEAGTHKFLFDAGRGAAQRLRQAKVRWQDIDGVFFTHLHSDHVVGFPDLWLTGWLVGPGRDRPLQVWGPNGTRSMMDHLSAAFAFDIRVRQSDDRASPSGVLIRCHEVEDGFVYSSEGVRITAFEVDHGPVKPALGYRIDYKGRSVVLSGDTRKSATLVARSRGVDVLIHEVAAPASFQRAAVTAERIKSVLEHHVSPQQAGEIFTATAPRLAVFSHIVQPDASDQELLSVKGSYTGPLAIGEDLMVIEVGETIRVVRPQAAATGAPAASTGQSRQSE